MHKACLGGNHGACIGCRIGSRSFHQRWAAKELIRGYWDECITDRHKLRPLVNPKDDLTDEQKDESLTEKFAV